MDGNIIYRAPPEKLTNKQIKRNKKQRKAVKTHKGKYIRYFSYH